MPPEKKLEVIAAAPVTVLPSLNGFKLALPYIEGLRYVPHYSREHDAHTLHIERINVGDEALQGNGIGTRLLRAAVRHAMEEEHRPSELTAKAVRLGLLNTVIRVAGRENTTASLPANSYGADSDQSLEEMFEELPFQEGEPYIIPSVVAKLDAAIAAKWEMPQAA